MCWISFAFVLLRDTRGKSAFHGAAVGVYNLKSRSVVLVFLVSLCWAANDVL